MSQIPRYSCDFVGDAVRFSLAGHWTIDSAPILENQVASLLAKVGSSGRAVLDLGGIDRLDTSGAWLIDRTREDLGRNGVDARVENLRPEYEILLSEAKFRRFPAQAPKRTFYGRELLADIGESIVNVGRDVLQGVAFLGEVVVALAKTIAKPSRFRFTSLVFHMETFAFRSVPIIALINFLVGCIIAQRGVYLLQRFGATTYAVDLIGILVLRELGVLLTSIMIAGRSGSAITAELGSMKMREEIDALYVMGMRPVEVLIVPRIIALMLSLPLLTFVADMSALFGGLLVAWGYGGISPDSFMDRLQNAVALSDLWVGLIKAPFMALVIGLIASIEGLSVEGSAESLGRKVTASVVKAIFTVIVVDGLFSMFFSAIDF
ncbi:ABC transporter permease [Methylovirgula sp. HY1]|uniref:ABC transporter permease n=1 Tax=Methylovirgula sp. HY1 TaxID=2822761 RepID=UPI001C5BB7A0|nr:MlaE family lipid ABC transporter permease subunit [Methylovirgula sp. HY1]QXX74402.1 putative phospholipid ABC transporter permease protein MlaE [Methylovirgula sp. HY1]